ncbi:hypothetical protein FHY55_19480 [Oceanicola sp. D3]|uniref:hypothetical protein n=1 Tax=Oceanicola sp. D3 TaxID=2587163 RepID=UPI00111F7FE0|nr:hypothetical protein [Oceanicola sp. D3]QDC11281.1 hypothetical protein FHY55_19480 [Oceanicola sp. D3]
MAKQVSVRLTTDGGDRVRAVFLGIGEEGKKAFGKIDQGAKSASASASVFEKATLGSQKQVDALKASIDPTFRAQQQFARAQELVNRAVENGAISQRQAAELLQQTRAAYSGAADGMQALDRSTRSANPGLRNVSLQLSQVAQQGAATGDYVRALAIQLPDMAIGLGTVGILAGVAVGALVPFVAALFDGGDAAEALDDQLKALGESISAISEAQSAASASAAEMQNAYGRLTDEAKAIFEINRQIASIRAEDALQGVARGIADQLGAGSALDLLPEQFRDLTLTIAELELQAETAYDALAADLGDNPERLRELESAFVSVTEELGNVQNAAKNLDKLSEALGVSEEEAREVLARFAEIGQANGAQAQAEAMARLTTYIFEVSNGLEGASDWGVALYDGLRDGTVQALELAKIDIASGIAAAASTAAQLANNLGISVANASKILAMGGGSSDPVILDPRDPRYDPVKAEMVRLREDAGSVSPFDPSRAPKVKNARGGGGGASASQKAMNDQLRDAERIFEATRTAQEKYNAELRHAKDLLDAGAISTETFTRYQAQLSEQLEKDAGGFDYLTNGIDGVSEAMARTLVYGDDLREGLRAVWQGIAFDILNSAIRDALKSVFDMSGFGGSSSWFGKIVGSVFSFDGGGHTGYGPRSGGLDGKGGYLAMVHPRERVIDETRAQQEGGASVVQVALSEGLVGQILQQAAGQSVQIVGGALQAERSTLNARLQQVGARGTSVS